MTSAVVFMIALLAAIYLWVMGLVAKKRSKHYRKILDTERTRTRWAQARQVLLRVVRNGELDVRSPTFQVFNGWQTFVLRRPDAYDEIARSLHKAIVEGPRLATSSRDTPLWYREVPKWPPAMANVLALMNKGIDALILSHLSLPRRLATRFYLVKHGYPLLTGMSEYPNEARDRRSKPDSTISHASVPATLELSEVKKQLSEWRDITGEHPVSNKTAELLAI